MAFLSGFNISLAQAELLGRASLAAFDGAPIPAGWTVVTPASLGLGAIYQDGNYYKDGDTGASAIVLRQNNAFIVSFRGTDDSGDVARYPELYFGTYIDHFTPLLNALKASAPANAHFSFTGASLGGGATNNMAAIAQSKYGGTFANSDFVAFASPIISNASGILNLGVENDPIYKSVPNPIWAPRYQDYASSADNLVLANDAYVAGNGEQDSSAHSDKDAFSLFGRFQSSIFYDDMSLDSTIVIAASDGLIQDKGAGRENTGAFYLGRDDRPDRMTGRAGDDKIEGFGGDDILDGGGGNDKIHGGAGNDTLTGAEGDDRFIYVAGGNADIVTDFVAGAGGIDELDLRGLGIATFAQALSVARDVNGGTVFDFGGGNTLTLDNVAVASLVESDFIFSGAPAGEAGVTILGTKGTDVIDAGNSPGSQPRPTDGADIISSLGGADRIAALGGDDRVNGGAGLDTIDAGEGDDMIVIAGTEATLDVMNGGAGTDTVMVSGKSKVVLAGFDAAAASIEIWQGNKAGVLGDNADNVFDFSTLSAVSGVAYIDAAKGNDVLTGSSFADDLRGGHGNDLLTGGAGNDILAGNKGVDTFVFGLGFGHDRITDFTATTAAHDVIQFDDALFADYAAVMQHATQVGKAVVIALDAGNSLTLDRTTLANLTVDDFTFV